MNSIKMIIDDLDHPDPSCVQNAKAALIALGSAAVEPLLKELAYDDPRRRWEIIAILAKLHDPRATPAVAKFLFAKHGALRIAAAQCLGEIGDQRATSTLLLALEENCSSGALIWIVQALGRLKDVRAVEALLDVVRHTASAAVRYTAIEALGLIGDRRAVETIKEYRDDESAHVRARVEVALERLGAAHSSQILELYRTETRSEPIEVQGV